MLLGLLRIPRRIRFLLVKFAKYLHSAAWTLIRHVPYLVISLNSHLQSVIICRRRRLVPSNSTVYFFHLQHIILEDVAHARTSWKARCDDDAGCDGAISSCCNSCLAIGVFLLYEHTGQP